MHTSVLGNLRISTYCVVSGNFVRVVLSVVLIIAGSSITSSLFCFTTLYALLKKNAIWTRERRHAFQIIKMLIPISALVLSHHTEKEKFELHVDVSGERWSCRSLDAV